MDATFTPDFAAMPGRGVTLHVARAGPEDGPLVVLLHGFPEFWYGWRHQIGPLAQAGFRVLAPDQRGYNLSEKPRGLIHYALDALADDVLALIDATGRTKASVVGHDWGGIVAWWLALRHPEKVERVAVLNAPHPEFLLKGIRKHPSQLLRSWYVLYFQLPWLPEAGLGWAHGKALAESLRKTSRPGAFTDDDLARYRQAWSQPGALKAMINWYRAAVRAMPDLPADPRIHVPALIGWGTKDAFILPEVAHDALARCDQARLVFFEEATHWVHLEEPERVNHLLTGFLRSSTIADPVGTGATHASGDGLNGPASARDVRDGAV
ncbi:MAG: alpha/beta hydrolase [Isosphaeraceae bacterium]